MQKQYETYLEYQHRVLCENSSRLTGNIINPKCYDSNKEYQVIIQYSECETDTLYLCSSCMDAVKRDARRHGYAVKTIKIKKVVQ